MMFQIIWILLYILILCCLFFLASLVFSYIKAKPLGRETLFDLLVCDVLRIVPSGVAVITLVHIIHNAKTINPEIIQLFPQITWRIYSLLHYFATTAVTNSISLVLIVRTVSILFIGIVDEYLKDRHAVLSFRVGIVSVSGFAVFLELIVNGHGLFYSRMVLLNIADHKVTVLNSLADNLMFFLLIMQFGSFLAMLIVTRFHNSRLRKAQIEIINKDKFKPLPHFMYLTIFETFIITATLCLSISARFRTYSTIDVNIVNTFTLTSYFLLFVFCPMLYIHRTPQMREYVFGKLFRFQNESTDEIESISKAISELNIKRNRVGLMV